ncbi:MAG TPA: beta-eliminating lyase-related protein [Anaerolineae bacterium]|nr:beta-eliminating lyase-related protein [Anaerolineae bacterium]
MDQSQIASIRNACTRFVSGHYPLTVPQMLNELIAAAQPDLRSDIYGQGDFINDFEKRIAELLGKEAAVFMPSGTMAQPIALRIWSDRNHSQHVAFHPTCHLELHEQKGYQLLHGLHGVLVGSPAQLMTLADLDRVNEPLAALLIELPQREIGGQLPEWNDLVAMTHWARERGIALHLDGARLWECQPFYQREYREIAALFDTVYVSFYKILGGIAGAILAGPADIIAEARIWQRRQGGNLIRLFPYVLSAQIGLEQRLPRMTEYRKKAVEIAQALTPFLQIDVVPNPPQVNMLHVFLRSPKDRLEAAALEIAQEQKVWLFNQPLTPTEIPELNKFELTVGDAALDLDTNEIAALFRSVFEQADRLERAD